MPTLVNIIQSYVPFPKYTINVSAIIVNFGKEIFVSTPRATEF
jgi:hypothetical protein